MHLAIKMICPNEMSTVVRQSSLISLQEGVYHKLSVLIKFVFEDEWIRMIERFRHKLKFSFESKSSKVCSANCAKGGRQIFPPCSKKQKQKNEHQQKITFNGESHVPGHSEESLDGDSKDRVQGASQADLRYWQQDGNKHGEDLQNSR